jgi:hypothetical protein
VNDDGPLTVVLTIDIPEHSVPISRRRSAIREILDGYREWYFDLVSPTQGAQNENRRE